MATVPDDEGIAIEAQGCSPTLAHLVGLEAVRRETKPIRDPREEAGGKWLDPRRSELMDEALWDNLERLKKQRKWKERGVAEREAKRQRRDEEEAMRPFSPAGPSLSSNTTGSTRPRPTGTLTPNRADLDPPGPLLPLRLSLHLHHQTTMTIWNWHLPLSSTLRRPKRAPPRTLPAAASPRNERSLEDLWRGVCDGRTAP